MSIHLRCLRIIVLNSICSIVALNAARCTRGPAGPTGPVGASGLNALGYLRTVIVSPVDDPHESGLALISALAGITSATEASPFLLKLEPGVYHVDRTALAMKQFVDIEGSGELGTKIIGIPSRDAGIIIGTDNAELRNLTIENHNFEGGGLYVAGTSPRLTQLTVTGSGTEVKLVNSQSTWNG